MNMYMPRTKSRNPSKTANSSRKKRCPNGSRRDKKSGRCAHYKGIKIFKELNEEDISDKPTISIETLDKGAIFKVYKEGELVAQTFIDEKELKKSKEMDERVNKLILKTIRKIKKDPTVLQKDKKFLRFQKKMMKKRGGGSEERTPPEDYIEIQVQEGVMEKIQSPKIMELQTTLAELEGELEKEVDLYYNSWSSFNGILAVMNVVGTVSGIFEYGDIGAYFQTFVTSGLMTNFIFFITNITAYSFSTEDVNSIQTIVSYIIYIITSSFQIALLMTGNIFGSLIIQDSLWLVDIVLISVKNYMISNREKGSHELRLERDIADTKIKLLKAMEK